MPQTDSTSSTICPKATLKEGECVIVLLVLKQQPCVIEEIVSWA